MSFRKDNRVALENDLVRVEIAEKVTGQARYTTDQYPDRMLWAAYIRCPYGLARVQSSALEAARGIEGVLEAELTGRDVNYAGARIGHICAETRYALGEAMAALDIRFRRRTPETRAEDLATPVADIEAPGNQAEVDQALQGSAVVHEATYETQVQTHCCLEPHSAVVDYRGDHAIAWGSTQGTFSFRNELTGPLGLEANQVELHCEHVGGGFGSKFGAGPEGQLAARMSKQFGRPCRVALDRKEEQLDSGNRPGSVQYMKVGVSADGTIQGARVHTAGLVGPVGGGGGVSNPSRYRFGAVAKSHEDLHLNAGFPRAMRAPGHPQAMFAIEQMMDELAIRVDQDPVAFRIRNETSDVRREMLRVGAERIGWARRQPGGAWPGTVKHGFGVGVGDWGNGRGNATVQVDVYPNGTVEARSGSQDIGTGFRSLIRDCVAHELHIPGAAVTPLVGVSTYPPGPASGGSVTSRMVAPRALGAAKQARVAMIHLVAGAWACTPGQVTIRDGEFAGPDDQSLAWKAACRLITDDRMTFSESTDDEFWRDPTGSDAVQFAEVTVDIETGIVRVAKIVAIQDVGQVVNRITTENQICGAVIQGLSFALFEDRILNRPTGAMVNPNMEMYKIAGPADVPVIEPILWTSRDDAGVNSLGEPPVVPTAGAIGCAVANAIGAPIRRIPITPRVVLDAIDGEGES